MISSRASRASKSIAFSRRCHRRTIDIFIHDADPSHLPRPGQPGLQLALPAIKTIAVESLTQPCSRRLRHRETNQTTHGLDLPARSLRRRRGVGSAARSRKAARSPKAEGDRGASNDVGVQLRPAGERERERQWQSEPEAQSIRPDERRREPIWRRK